MAGGLTFARALTTASRIVPEYQRRHTQLSSFMAVAESVRDLRAGLIDEYQRRFGYVVYVDRSDTVYNDLLGLLREQIPTGKQRLVQAEAYVNNGWDDERDEPTASGAHVELTVASRFDRVCQIGGHRMRVQLVDRVLARPGASQTMAPGLYFFARNVQGRDAVVDVMRAMAERRITEPEAYDPSLYVRHNNTWQRANVPFRPASSVILEDGQLERIQQDLQGFLDAERFYVHRSIPWHRGYLFHGPAGVGKTSLVRGLSKHFGLDLWTVSLGDLGGDSELVGLVSEIRGRGILLLEDVDVYTTVHTREQTKGNATLSGLLNTLDGVSTPHGLVTILTTNYPEKLDAALTRPGRIDVVEELGPPTPDQARRLFEYFYERPVSTDWSHVNAPSVASMVEVFKRYLYDPVSAEQEMTGSLVAA